MSEARTLHRPAESPRATPEAAPPSLYASHRKVYPRAVRGTIRQVKWVVLALCLGLYYLVPWLRWNRGPGVPDQAVLVDIQHARIFLFGLEIWPQDIYLVTLLMIFAAFGLFAVSSLFGRLWCGFTCPQTVWTDLFMLVERWIEGDRNARMRMDRGAWTREVWLRKTAKHAAWLFIALATGGAWIMYFADAPTIVRDFFTGRASFEAYFFIALFTATTYLLAGWAREQVCTYMCPWPRFQSAMLDENSLVVTYRDWRGEPRGKAKAQGVGDCVDCLGCVHVCPTGIDIREGQQMECIGCGLCIDACNEVMAKLHREGGLIAFETLTNLEASSRVAAPLPPGPQRLAAGMAARKAPRFLRPRTLVYAGALAVVGAVMLGAFLMRAETTLTVLRERAPLYVRLSEGGVRNAYTLRVANKTREAATLSVVMDAPPGHLLSAPDAETDGQGRPVIESRPDTLSQLRVFVTRGPGPAPESVAVTFSLLKPDGRVAARESSVFLGPKP
ncbi:cytochrome c oxidase accessory protein CcoG [Roseomonas sp. OT10]|uniref:cytochrome c oxidase accessory protein CcoG n=1 Tax=Roseomonas cutis TaxID=2897332 RepID=UPI001E4E8D0D|nr:cytochrome c oxidase accessory protein CcoG [Roseomonas sp. OT10]UFN48632.1 cytochrome c oxidase accessory protein CcoG [Roseomonas sp. OT10]